MNTKISNHSASLGYLAAQGCQALRGVSASPRLDAEVLLAHTAGISRSVVFAFSERTIRPEMECRYFDLIAKRVNGMLVAQLVGKKEFYSLEFVVTADTLVPRPETELLVEKALAWIPEKAKMSILDIGTGTGAIALAIKKHRPHACITGVDVSEAALFVAKGNGVALDLDVRWLRSSAYSALSGERFDLIVTNPPYVEKGDPCLLDDICFEPRLALDGGTDGLDIIRVIVAGAKKHLSPNGRLLMEHGLDQSGVVTKLLQANSFEVLGSYCDLARHPRALGAQVVTP